MRHYRLQKLKRVNYGDYLKISIAINWKSHKLHMCECKKQLKKDFASL